jgi:hypothetical protein
VCACIPEAIPRYIVAGKNEGKEVNGGKRSDLVSLVSIIRLTILKEGGKSVRKKTLSVLLGIFLAIIMVFGLLPSCGEAGNSINNTNPAAPVAAGEVFNWRYQSTALAGTPTYWVGEEYVAVMKKASAGRLNFDYQPQGAIVGSMEIFDAVATGAIESGSS